MKVHSYFTIHEESVGDYREKGSKFLAYSSPISSLDQAARHIERIKKLHPKARHICYAYRIGADRQLFRAQDDGEPSGTAGLPILQAIDSFEVTNTICAIVRYFGGTKLGKSGLIRAYKTAALDSLRSSKIIEKHIQKSYRVRTSYELSSIFHSTLSKWNIEPLSVEYGDEVVYRIELPISSDLLLIRKLKSFVTNQPLDAIEEKTIVEGIHFELVTKEV